MVVLPLPVGHVTRIVPLFCAILFSICRLLVHISPRSSSGGIERVESRIRHTAFSPYRTGSVEIRTSIFPHSSLIRYFPSCGISVILSLRFDLYLRRSIMSLYSGFESVKTVARAQSIRNRTFTSASVLS